MSSPVLQLGADNTIGEACDLMKKKQFRHLAIVDRTGYLKGILTPSNIVNLLGSESFSSLAQARDVMHPRVVVGEKDSTLKELACEILEKRSCCAIVMDKDFPVGIIPQPPIHRCA